ncbi:MAG: nucleotidyl transferase AbiEii/AbiGii toxin family protein [Lachnospiraceae bacterium]|nr:nucleotidyl transferase AbiEii/AbiGii toxin family protein [Lachnospiraceae bacterium]
MDKTNEFRLFEIKNRIKQAIQGNIMYALSKDGFFDMAALHGDKARRLQYDLEGFSGHLEFSLFKSDPDFKIDSLLPSIERELADNGLEFKVEVIDKPYDFKKSVVLKGNTRQVFMNMFPGDKIPKSISDADTVNVRFEMNYDPPMFAGYEKKTCLYPSPYEITVYDKPSLFAEKIDHTIFRAWMGRVRGRDLYDYVFYLIKKVPYNHKHLVARLLKFKYVEAKEDMTLDEVKANLGYRFREINYQEAKRDLLPFIENPQELDVWSVDYFLSITQWLNAQ